MSGERLAAQFARAFPVQDVAAHLFGCASCAVQQIARDVGGELVGFDDWLQGKPGQGYPAALVGPLVLADGVVVCGCGLRVRRLTPRECERLMGLPDDWTHVPLKTYGNGRVKTTSDSARYRLCGNAVAVPVVAWIARRLAQVDAASSAGGMPGGGGFPR